MTLLTRKIQGNISHPGRPPRKANQEVAKKEVLQELSNQGSSVCRFYLGTGLFDKGHLRRVWQL